MSLILSFQTFLLTCFIFGFFCNLEGVSGLSFDSEFTMPKELVQEPVEGFLTNFYTAVDKGQGEKVVKFFTDDPIPEAHAFGKVTKGKENIQKLFQRKVNGATYEKKIQKISRVKSDNGFVLKVEALVTQTMKNSGNQAQKAYEALLHFVDGPLDGHLFKMEVNMKDIPKQIV